MGLGLIKKDNVYYLPEGKPDQPLRLVQLPDQQVELVKRIYGLPEDVNPAHVISLGGKPYIVKEGLVDLAHKRGVKEIISKEVKVVKCSERGCVRQIQKGYKDHQGNVYERHSEVPHELWKAKKVYKNMVEIPAKDNEYCFIYGTEVVMKDGNRYYAEGDACPHNTTSMVRNALARMAQTRSTNIALGRALNVCLTSAEELPNINVDFETGEITVEENSVKTKVSKKGNLTKEKKMILKTINELRETIGMEKEELKEVAEDMFSETNPEKLKIAQLEELKKYLTDVLNKKLDEYDVNKGR